MRSLVRGSLLAVTCFGLSLPLVGARPDEKPKVVLEFKRAETKPTDGYAEAAVAGTDTKIYLPKRADVTNTDIAEAKAILDGAGKPAINITFTKEGAKKMAALTEKHRDKPLAVLVNGRVVSAPIIRATINEKAQLMGSFSQEEVDRLVEAINAK